MSTVVVAIANDAAAPAVLTTAYAVANVLGATVEPVHVGAEHATAAEAARHAGVTLRTVPGTPLVELARAALPDDVAAIVLGAPGEGGATRPAGSTALQLITMLEKPVVVVRWEGGAGDHRIDRILVPLDGTAGSAAALHELVRLARDAAVEIVVAHVH